MNKGKIVQVMGPVVDVVFEDGQGESLYLMPWNPMGTLAN